MIHIDNLDGEGTIFMSTDDGTQSIGHVEKEYASILQDVLESYDWHIKEVKRLREELFNTHAFYSNMEQMLAFAVGIKQGLLKMSMDDLMYTGS